MSAVTSSGTSVLIARTRWCRVPGLTLLFCVLAIGACTAIGCESILRIEFADVEFQPETTYPAELTI
jgi:hypothetical protein